MNLTSIVFPETSELYTYSKTEWAYDFIDSM